MATSNSEPSRAVSHALRHAPWLYELELDDEGWVPVEQLLAALRAQDADWQAVDQATLERMVAQRVEAQARNVRRADPSALWPFDPPDGLRGSGQRRRRCSTTEQVHGPGRVSA